MRVGLLGGSFNPAHDGHRHISLEALKLLRLDAVWWLVSPQNPLKPSEGMAGLADRVEGARRVARHPRIVVTDIERQLGTRYTADTLTALSGRFPRTRFVWLMGADNLLQLPRWDRWTVIFHTVPVAIFDRPSYSLRALGGEASQRFARRRVTADRIGRLADMAPPAWAFLHTRLHPASATALRGRSDDDAGKAQSSTNVRSRP